MNERRISNILARAVAAPERGPFDPTDKEMADFLYGIWDGIAGDYLVAQQGREVSGKELREVVPDYVGHALFWARPGVRGLLEGSLLHQQGSLAPNGLPGPREARTLTGAAMAEEDSWSDEKLLRKADQAYEMAGLAAADGDSADCTRWTLEAKRLDAIIRERRGVPPKEIK